MGFPVCSLINLARSENKVSEINFEIVLADFRLCRSKFIYFTAKHTAISTAYYLPHCIRFLSNISGAYIYQNQYL